mgnify:FL=1|tara:strand:+ start:1263 stop:1541 length:279 start_codon:yes stop_codon:yes gene_type:complete
MKKQNSIKKMIITIAMFIISIQPINANEKNINKLSNIFNSYWENLNKEIKKTKDYQVREWQEAKKERTKSFKIVQHKLTGFFSNFPTIKGDK